MTAVLTRHVSCARHGKAAAKPSLLQRPDGTPRAHPPAGWGAAHRGEAAFAARRLGWLPASATVIVVCLNSAAVARSLGDHRALLASSFPGDAAAMAAWLRDPAAPPPSAPTLVVTDLAPHRGLALASAGLHGRAPTPSYRDDAEAAGVLVARRPARRLRRSRGS